MNGRKKTYTYKWLKIKSDFPITEEQILKIAYIIEEAITFENPSSIGKKISNAIGESINTVSIKLKSSLFRHKVKAIVELTTK